MADCEITIFTGTRRNMSHAVELRKDCTSAVLMWKQAGHWCSRNDRACQHCSLRIFSSQRSKDGHVFYHWDIVSSIETLSHSLRHCLIGWDNVSFDETMSQWRVETMSQEWDIVSFCLKNETLSHSVSNSEWLYSLRYSKSCYLLWTLKSVPVWLNICYARSWKKNKTATRKFETTEDDHGRRVRLGVLKATEMRHGPLKCWVQSYAK
jgi:hypothetical protein